MYKMLLFRPRFLANRYRATEVLKLKYHVIWMRTLVEKTARGYRCLFQRTCQTLTASVCAQSAFPTLWLPIRRTFCGPEKPSTAEKRLDRNSSHCVLRQKLSHATVLGET